MLDRTQIIQNEKVIVFNITNKKYRKWGICMSVRRDLTALNKLLSSRNDIHSFSKYSKIYAFTTENIASYYSKLEFHNKKVLTICSSGDHILNAILLGCYDIDCFDINIFTKYYMFLKLGAIKALEYNEFVDFFINHKFEFELYKKISNYLENNIKLFWDSVYSKFNIDLLVSKLFIKTDYVKTNDFYNLYLNKESYSLLKSKLLNNNIYINFIEANIFDLDRIIDKKYDYIFLSNIIDYLPSFYIENSYKNYIEYILNFLVSKQLAVYVFYCYIYNYDLKNKLSTDMISFSNLVNVKQIDCVGVIKIIKNE